MNPLAAEIRSRGHWWVRFRPAVYNPNRIDDFSSLSTIVQTASVNWRGWDFPHVDSRDTPELHENYVGSQTDWQHHREMWRMYQSGQFAFLGGLAFDWRDRSGLWPPNDKWRPGSGLGIGETVVEVTQIFEFAARLAQSPAGADFLNIIVELHGLEGRRIYDDRANRDPTIFASPATTKKWSFNSKLERTHIITQTRHLAAASARDLFHRFGWELPVDAVRDMQKQFAPDL